MPVPDYQSFYRPLLEFAAKSGEPTFKDAVDGIAHRFQLTPEERAQMIPSGSQRLLENRVGWART